MTNPFDDESLEFLVLRNDEDECSLWPASFDVPAGWHVVLGPKSRQECLAHIDKTWTDMRLRTLREAMAASAGC